MVVAEGEWGEALAAPTVAATAVAAFAAFRDRLLTKSAFCLAKISNCDVNTSFARCKSRLRLVSSATLRFKSLIISLFRVRANAAF